MKRGLILSFVFGMFISLLLIGFVSASFSIGNLSHLITDEYGPGESLRGWFNISLNNEPSNSLLTGFNSNITILNFLDANNADYYCVPDNCEKGYSINGSGSASKDTFNVYPTEWLIGLKLNGQISSISSLSFDVEIATPESCINPLRIDIGDDDFFEWKADKSADSVCGVSGTYGCFEGNSVEETPISSSYFCEEIEVLPFNSFRVGAMINGSGAAVFEMTLEVNSEEEDCQISTSVGGVISCDINLTEALIQSTTAKVCIRKISGSTVYKIKFEEDANRCGYVKDSYGDIEPYSEQDFEMFAKPRKYASINDFTFNQNLVGDVDDIDLANTIMTYINENYNDGNCSNDCIIPIKFHFGTVQATTISNLTLDYKKFGRDSSESIIYELRESESSLNSGFLKLELEKASLSVPTEVGVSDLTLKLGNSEIFTQSIRVKSIPQIIDLVPKSIPALVSFPIIAVLNGNLPNMTFKWNFGDGNSAITTTNNVRHTYLTTGNYNLQVNISNAFGSSSRTFPIVVGSPKNYINGTINEYRNNINKIEGEINILPLWIKTEIIKKANLEDLKTSINSLETRFKSAFEPDEYLNVMEGLVALKIPNELNFTQVINPFDFFPNENQLDLQTLETLGAGSADETREIYASAANNWIRRKLGILLESKTYSLFFVDSEEPIFSYFKLILNPAESLDEFYLVVNGNPDEIMFNEGIEVKKMGDVAVGTVFADLSESKTIEFLYPGAVDITSLPIYISPEFNNLDIDVVPGPCNNDGTCDSGENYKNCRRDCKPITWAVMFLIILFFIAFVIYIILQEWYKKNYESRLFPDKSQLFNLVNFMEISLNQGVRRSQIADKLKDLGWNNEQLNYVWNKLHGKRTGMWEIPIFKWVENRRVKKELAKRKGIPGNQGLNYK